MKLALLVFFAMLLQVAVTQTVYNKEEEVPIVYNDPQIPQLWQKSSQVEGDMVLTPEQAEIYSGKEKRNGIIDISYRWPNRRIPYVLSNHFTSREKNEIERILRQEFARTCIRMVRRNKEHDFVYVTGRNTGCWSKIGRIGGIQILNLERGGCLSYPTVVHEFLHAAGFYHMQSTSNRDQFVNVHLENVEKDHQFNFDKLEPYEVSNFGQPYDYGSVMHYHDHEFSKNGRRTIIPRRNVEIGTAKKLSRIDIAKLNRMYNC